MLGENAGRNAGLPKPVPDGQACSRWPSLFPMRNYRCGPMRENAFSAQNTWLCKLAIHCRPAAVTFRYATASSRYGETLVQ